MGNAIALGHPFGATGAILTLTCAHACAARRSATGAMQIADVRRGSVSGCSTRAGTQQTTQLALPSNNTK
jgi:acetyl-CoA acetyltransferase